VRDKQNEKVGRVGCKIYLFCILPMLQVVSLARNPHAKRSSVCPQKYRKNQRELLSPAVCPVTRVQGPLTLLTPADYDFADPATGYEKQKLRSAPSRELMMSAFSVFDALGLHRILWFWIMGFVRAYRRLYMPSPRCRLLAQ